MTSRARQVYVFTYPDGTAGRVRGTVNMPLLTHVLIGYSARQQRWIVRGRDYWPLNPTMVVTLTDRKAIPVHPAPPKRRRRRRKSLALPA